MHELSLRYILSNSAIHSAIAKSLFFAETVESWIRLESLELLAYLATICNMLSFMVSIKMGLGSAVEVIMIFSFSSGLRHLIG